MCKININKYEGHIVVAVTFTFTLDINYNPNCYKHELLIKYIFLEIIIGQKRR